MFESVVNGSGGLTRVPPPGTVGHGSPTGSLSKNNAGIFLEVRPFGPDDQLEADTKGTLAELMHLGGQNRRSGICRNRSPRFFQLDDIDLAQRPGVQAS